MEKPPSAHEGTPAEILADLEKNTCGHHGKHRAPKFGIPVECFSADRNVPCAKNSKTGNGQH
jgi:hypothetical protein